MGDGCLNVVVHPDTILRLGRYGSTCEMLGIYISVKYFRIASPPLKGCIGSGSDSVVRS